MNDTSSARDYANGYKPKTVKTRVGEIQFAVPQVTPGRLLPGCTGERTAQ